MSALDSRAFEKWLRPKLDDAVILKRSKWASWAHWNVSENQNRRESPRNMQKNGKRNWMSNNRSQEWAWLTAWVWIFKELNHDVDPGLWFSPVGAFMGLGLEWIRLHPAHGQQLRLFVFFFIEPWGVARVSKNYSVKILRTFSLLPLGTKNMPI